MSYTWEEVMLNIDVRNEAEKERQQQQDILDKQAEEENAMSLWSLGLSVLGGALLGPAGYAAGKIIGRGVGDITHDWEDMAVDIGKFYKKDAEEFKRTRDKAATDQTQGQIFNAVTDLATMYVQAGGLQEGPTDLTTFGSGDDAWSVFGKSKSGAGLGEWTDAATGEEFWSVDPSTGIGTDYTEGLFSSWQKGEGLPKNLKPVGQKLKSANTGISSLGNLYQSFLSSEEEKAAS
tara:strand:+ start:17 stop:718 length:702 start_codon:yes stop_codon:yes gene_type:complete